jgi:hypothetical protein
MARIFITGSADGLGRAAAETLLEDGHEVIVHARSTQRLAAVNDLIDGGASAVVGDLADLDQTQAVAEQVNRLGRVDAVIHNAGIYSGRHIMPVNIVAPYLLTAGPARTRTANCSSPPLPSLSPASGPMCTATPSTPAGCPPEWADPVLPTTSGSGTSPKNGSLPVTNPRRAAAADTGSTNGSALHTRQSATRASKTPCLPRWRASPVSRWPDL